MTKTREAAWALLNEFTRSDSLIQHSLAVETCVLAYARRFGEDETLWGMTALLHDFDYERYPDPPDHPIRGSEILAGRGWPEALRRAILAACGKSGQDRVRFANAVLRGAWAGLSPRGRSASPRDPKTRLRRDFGLRCRSSAGPRPRLRAPPRLGPKSLAHALAPFFHSLLGHAEWTGVPRDTPLARTLYACDELAGFLTAVALVRPSRRIADVEVSSVKKKLKDKAFARGVNRDDVVRGAEEIGVPLDEHISFCLEAMKARATDLGL